MNRTIKLISLAAFLVCCSLAKGQDIAGTVNDDGKIVISGTAEMIGIDLRSPGGFLVPSREADPSPFGIVVVNTAQEIAFGSLGIDNSVSLDGSLVLDAGYADVDTFDLIGTWGGPDAGQEGEIAFTEPVPEPASGLLAMVALTLASLFRRRRLS